jgi:mono/diheme cytochrome c family protein
VSEVKLKVGDAARGEALASVCCSNCHMVEGNRSGNDAATPLAAIARRRAPDQLQACAFLASPHPSMPNFNLARQDIDDIVAYLNSLARP